MFAALGVIKYHRKSVSLLLRTWGSKKKFNFRKSSPNKYCLQLCTFSFVANGEEILENSFPASIGVILYVVYLNLCMKLFYLQEVRELFSGEGCPKWTSCEFAFNNYWNIQFETEGDAQKVRIGYPTDQFECWRFRPGSHQYNWKFCSCLWWLLFRAWNMLHLLYPVSGSTAA